MLDQKGISRREFVLGAGAAVASLPFLNLGELLTEDKKLNFIFILTDDQRWDAMSCAGHPHKHGVDEGNRLLKICVLPNKGGYHEHKRNRN